MVNAHVAAREWKDDIVFLRKIVPGRSDRSYGIQVARLAGLPPGGHRPRAEILDGLERDELSRGGRPTLSRRAPAIREQQLGLFADGAGRRRDADARTRSSARLRRSTSTTRRRARRWRLLAELKQLADDDGRCRD